MKWSRVKSSVLFLIMVPALTLGVLAGVGGSSATAQQADCDDNAVIRCGVSSATDLKQKCAANQQGNVQQVFAYFGIPNCSSALDGLVQGRITSDNKVYVGNELVATNAVTVGRQNMSGSTPILNGAFYQRPPSVSFRSGSLTAYVKMNNGRFMYAVIASCGNPVKATPVEKPKPKPTFKCEGLNIRRINRNTFELKANGSAQNATITGYIFKINNQVKQDSASDTYTYTNNTPGTFTATVEVKTDKGNTAVESQCSKQIVIEQEQPQADFRCESLAVNRVNRTTYEFIAKPEVKNVTITGYIFMVNNEVKQDSTSDKYTFINNTPGNYTVTAQLKTDKGTTPVSANCSKEITVDNPPVITTGTNPTPVQPTSAAPAVLPDTGPGAALGLFSLTTVMGMALYRLKEYFLFKLNR